MKVFSKNKHAHDLGRTIFKCIGLLSYILSLVYNLKNNFIIASNTKTTPFCTIYICQNIELYLLNVHIHILIEKHAEIYAEEITTIYQKLYKETANPLKSMCLAVSIALKCRIEKKAAVSLADYKEINRDIDIEGFGKKINLDISKVNEKKEIHILKYFALLYISMPSNLEIKSLMLQGVKNLQKEKKNYLRDKVSLQLNIEPNKNQTVQFYDYSIRANIESKDFALEPITERNQVNNNNLEHFFYCHIHVDAFLFYIILGFESGNFDLKEAILQILNIKINTTKEKIQNSIKNVFKPINEQENVIKFLDSSLKALYICSFGVIAMNLILENINVIIMELWDFISEFYNLFLICSSNIDPYVNLQNLTMLIIKRTKRTVLPASPKRLKYEIERHEEKKTECVSEYLIETNYDHSTDNISLSKAVKNNENFIIFLLSSYANLSRF